MMRHKCHVRWHNLTFQANANYGTLLCDFDEMNKECIIQFVGRGLIVYFFIFLFFFVRIAQFYRSMKYYIYSVKRAYNTRVDGLMADGSELNMSESDSNLLTKSI